MYHCYLLLPSSSAQPSPNHSFRLRHHSICRLVLSDDTSGKAGGEMANTGVEIDTLDEILPSDFESYAKASYKTGSL